MIDDKLERFRTMVELAPVAIALFSGPQFIITEANERVLEYWGRNREEVMDKPLFEALPEASGQGFEELLHRVYTTGERFVARELTVTLKRKGRLEQTYIDFSYDPYRETDDTITGIIVVCLEVTDQVVARQKVQRSEHRFRSLIENASIPTCLFVGRDLRIEVANEAMIAVWGKGSSVLGQPLAVALPELRAQHFLTTLDDLFTSGHAYESKGGRADLVVNGQLSTFYFNYSFIPLRDEEGQVYAIMETAVDVTERILAEQQLIASEARYRAIAQDREEQVKLRTSELEKANLALQRSNANLELFASAASHDLQEPLRKIQSFSLLLKATY
ncbi:MAG: PAS domain S-box protein, partial [Cytophagaceae bacterium]